MRRSSRDIKLTHEAATVNPVSGPCLGDLSGRETGDVWDCWENVVWLMALVKCVDDGAHGYYPLIAVRTSLQDSARETPFQAGIRAGPRRYAS